MSILGDLRQEVADALATTGALIYKHLPEMINAPALVITPGSPYVTTDGQPFGHHLATFTLVAVADVSTNEITTEALDGLIESTIVALHAAGMPASEVGEPYAFQSNTAFHLASDITLQIPFAFI